MRPDVLIDCQRRTAALCNQCSSTYRAATGAPFAILWNHLLPYVIWGILADAGWCAINIILYMEHTLLRKVQAPMMKSSRLGRYQNRWSSPYVIARTNMCSPTTSHREVYSLLVVASKALSAAFVVHCPPVMSHKAHLAAPDHPIQQVCICFPVRRELTTATWRK